MYSFLSYFYKHHYIPVIQCCYGLHSVHGSKLWSFSIWLIVQNALEIVTPSFVLNLEANYKIIWEIFLVPSTKYFVCVCVRACACLCVCVCVCVIPLCAPCVCRMKHILLAVIVLPSPFTGSILHFHRREQFLLGSETIFICHIYIIKIWQFR